VPRAFDIYRLRFWKALLLGLELMVAADVVKNVTVTPTVSNIAGLGLLALIRTCLSWAMIVEIERHWPWRAPTGPEAELLSSNAS
jgi:uncharacterized membrane protein